MTIVEQILPFFTPDWTTTVRLIPEMNVEHDIPVVLGTVQQEDTYTGDFKERQALTWTLDFTMKSYLYGPVKTGAIILFANTVLYSPDANNYNTSNSISAAVGFTSPALYETILPGLIANGQPTSNAAQSIAANLISATSDFGYISNTFNLS